MAFAETSPDGGEADATALPNGVQANGTLDGETKAPVSPTPAADAAGPQTPIPELSEFDREFQKAKSNPSDFNQWVAVEKLLDKEVITLFRSRNASTTKVPARIAQAILRAMS